MTDVPDLPLAVDLDGTLVARDTMIDLSLAALASFDLLFPFALLRGRPYFKRRLASRYKIDLDRLRWVDGALETVRRAKADGREVWLVTAASELLAERVAARLELTGYKGTCDGVNLRGETKARWLVDRFGMRGFDYMGDSSADIAVWACSRVAYVAASYRHVERVEAVCADVRRF